MFVESLFGITGKAWQMNLWIPVLPGGIITCGYSEYSGSYRELERAVFVGAGHRDRFEVGRKDRRGIDGKLGIHF